MPPNIQKRLIRTLLLPDIQKFSFFFNENDRSNARAPEHFIVKVMSNLDSKLYHSGQVIIERGSPVENLILIKEGHCNLYSFFEPKTNNADELIKVLLVKLKQGSWYGDFQILLDSKGDL